MTAVEGRDALLLTTAGTAMGCRDDAVLANPHSINSFIVLFLENVNLALLHRRYFFLFFDRYSFGDVFPNEYYIIVT